LASAAWGRVALAGSGWPGRWCRECARDARPPRRSMGSEDC
jgi:hypothetical protein